MQKIILHMGSVDHVATVTTLSTKIIAWVKVLLSKEIEEVYTKRLIPNKWLFSEGPGCGGKISRAGWHAGNGHRAGAPFPRKAQCCSQPVSLTSCRPPGQRERCFYGSPAVQMPAAAHTCLHRHAHSTVQSKSRGLPPPQGDTQDHRHCHSAEKNVWRKFKNSQYE